MPQFPQHAGRRLARWVLTLAGWRLTGTIPDLPRAVMIGAPHSSWWDGVWGLLMKVAIGADVSFMAKRELFVGPLGWVLRKLGGIPIERSATHGLVEQMAARLREQPKLWVGIAPEGTRKRVAKWKSGFWHIARAAGVPIVPIHFHYPERTIGFGPPLMPGEDMDADIAALRAYYAPFRGKHRGVD
ncbi:MAG: lysophospholipid acyltransferase family protein [Dokdonella sp.]|nr:lysophospholipid acyltransferase family protein [Dokdonella sp.]MCW5566769.1 lysophospholipid acyltransferase family protein [Dokdonella sp.]